jgi:hypothetical protein
MNVVCKVETVLVVGDFVVVFVWVVDILFVLLEAMVVVVEAGGGEGHGHSPRNGMQRRRSSDLAGQWFREPYGYWNFFRRRANGKVWWVIWG